MATSLQTLLSGSSLTHLVGPLACLVALYINCFSALWSSNTQDGVIGLAYAATSQSGARSVFHFLDTTLFALCFGQTGGTLVTKLIYLLILFLSHTQLCQTCNYCRAVARHYGLDVVFRHSTSGSNPAKGHCEHLYTLHRTASLNGASWNDSEEHVASH